MRDMEDDGAVVLRRQEPTVDRTEDDDEDSDAEFELPFVSRETAAGGGAAAADELFAGGRVRAFYPVFGRVLDEAPAPASAQAPPQAPRAPLGRLFQLEQARTSSVASTSSSSSSASSSTADAGLDGASPDSYCLWTPGSVESSPSRPPRKSGSTGSVARWRRIGGLVVGRSHSDGKEKFLFLSAPSSPARDRGEHSPASKAPKQMQKGSKATAAAVATELDTVAARSRLSYGGAKASTGGRRTFLPYRQDLVGLFANVHGLSRSPHPF